MAISAYQKRIEAIEKKLKPKPGQNGTLRFYKISPEDDLAQNQNLLKYDTIVFLPMKVEDDHEPIWEFMPQAIVEDDFEAILPQVEVKHDQKNTQANTQQNEDTPQSSGGIRIEAIRWKTGNLNETSILNNTFAS